MTWAPVHAGARRSARISHCDDDRRLILLRAGCPRRHHVGPQVNVHLKPGPELEKVEREVAEHQRFQDLIEEVTVVSEAICEARRVGSPASAPPAAEGEKGGSSGRSRRSSPPR